MVCEFGLRVIYSCGLSLFIAQRVGKSDQLLFESTQERFSRKQQIEVGRTDVRRTSRLQWAIT